MQKFLPLVVSLLIGCVAADKEAEITLVQQGLPAVGSITALNSPCAAGDICSFQISGSDLGKVDRVSIDTGAATQQLNIVAQNDSALLVETVALLNIPINSLVEFTVENARGMAAIPVNFTIPANSITLAEIDVSTVASELVAGSSNLLLGNQNPVFSGTLTGTSASLTGAVSYVGASVTYSGNAFFNFQDSGGTEVIEMRPGVDIGLSIKDGGNLYIENAGQIQVGGDLGTATAPLLTIDGSTGNITTTGAISAQGTLSITGNTTIGSGSITGILTTTNTGQIAVDNGGTLNITNGSLITAATGTVDIDSTTATIDNLLIDGINGGTGYSLDTSGGPARFQSGEVLIENGDLNIDGAGFGINLTNGNVVINDAGAGGNLTIARDATVGQALTVANGVTVTAGGLQVQSGQNISTDGSFVVLTGAVPSSTLNATELFLATGGIGLDNGTTVVSAGNAGPGEILAAGNIVSVAADIEARVGNVISTAGNVQADQDVISVNGNVTANLGSVVAGSPISPLVAGVIYADQGLLVENNFMSTMAGYIYAGNIPGSTAANTTNGTITAELDIFSDAGSLILPTAQTAGVGGAGGMTGQYIDIPTGKPTGVANQPSINVGGGDVELDNGDLRINGATGVQPGVGNGDLFVAGEAEIQGSVRIGPNAFILSGEFPSATASLATRTFRVDDIGASAVIVEIDTVMSGGGIIAGSKDRCLLDMAGVDGAGGFVFQCEDLGDYGNFGGDPLDITATPSGAPPTTSVVFSLTNNTGAALNGSVTVKLTRGAFDALKPVMVIP